MHEPTWVVRCSHAAKNEYVYGALEAGASGFLLADLSERELDVLRLLAQGRSSIAASATST